MIIIGADYHPAHLPRSGLRRKVRSAAELVPR